MSDKIEPSLGPQKNNSILEPKPHVKEGAGYAGFYQPGTIAKEIGTGEHARDSFIWMTLKYCFYLGAIFSICIMLAYFHFVFDKNEPEKIDIVAALKDVWSIFTPILTLALGYAFGKRENNNQTS
ncbi:TPA: hypothetical protein LTW47_004088 [Enterobacter hormaechei]|nr:hypothetical protein [Enterobacter hormaechei]KYH16872.1 hypothetical protein A0133_08410 [Enterobacter hormaechei]HBL5510710.1 hypothetical protein [Enterobacter hormaechei]HBL8837265.1 hypothetical protein [Enterobacter hormaechei]HBL9039555.1 hypothetical protein [Enterobacter hormaechei]HBL9112972.1 hypothetical protein [Enterobacter hormaechei]